MTTAVAEPEAATAVGHSDQDQDAPWQALPLLADAAAYRPCTFDYMSSINGVTLQDWVEVFRHSIPTFERHCLTDETVPEARRQERAARFAQDFGGALDAVLRDTAAAPLPGAAFCPPVNCLTLCMLRDYCLHRQGFTDVFMATKAKENAAAMQLLPGVLADLDAIADDAARMESALCGVFAGNLFDLGAAASAKAYEEGGISFAKTKAGLLARPWAVDDLGALVQRLAGAGEQPHRRAVLFCDNAGADALLGMLPLARELAKRGTEVVLAANTFPSINDITARELEPLLASAAAADAAVLGPALAAGLVRVVANGTDTPVIDLRRLSPELCEEARQADLVVLEGMGRGIETNLRAAFVCDAACLALIKHPEVAQCLGGRLYDVVCSFRPAPAARQG